MTQSTKQKGKKRRVDEIDSDKANKPVKKRRTVSVVVCSIMREVALQEESIENQSLKSALHRTSKGGWAVRFHLLLRLYLASQDGLHLQIEDMPLESWVVKVCLEDNCTSRIKNTKSRNGTKEYTCFEGSYKLRSFHLHLATSVLLL